MITKPAPAEESLEPFTYILPADRIAQRPAAAQGSRTDSRLLHAAQRRDRSWQIEDRFFHQLAGLLRAGDLLVLNNSRVLPCRFFLQRPGGGELEVLLVRRIAGGSTEIWEALARPMRSLLPGRRLQLSEHLQAEVIGRTVDERRLQLSLAAAGEFASVQAVLEQEAGMPIPPYIRGGHADISDREWYQTVYGSAPGSVAAPTAGLHFTNALFQELAQSGIERTYITLHVGPASFLSVESQECSEPAVCIERYIIGGAAAQSIAAAKKRGSRVVAVGTTTVRALESAALSGTLFETAVQEQTEETCLMIRPGFSFRVVDCLITNFHQPDSTHLQLVSAFAGRPAVADIYSHALASDYRFLSYGDAMLLEPIRG